jgi:cellulose biosynthesis protein BcsQ
MAVVQGKHVLVVDLDSQASTTSVFINGEVWLERRTHNLTIGDYLTHIANQNPVNPTPYIVHQVGNVHIPNGWFGLGQQQQPFLDLLPSSHELEDRETELMISQAHAHPNIAALFEHLKQRTGQLIRTLGAPYEIVILDCPPGLSQIVWGALQAADFVIIPYVPDVTAEGNVGWLINRLTGLGLERYRTLANRASNTAYIDAVRGLGPSFDIHIPQRAALARALELPLEQRTMAQRFGNARHLVEQLSNETMDWINPAQEQAT